MKLSHEKKYELAYIMYSCPSSLILVAAAYFGFWINEIATTHKATTILEMAIECEKGEGTNE